MKKIIVTTGSKMEQKNVALAQTVAAQLGVPYVARAKSSIPALRTAYNADSVLVVRDARLFLDTPEGEFFFHPSMAHVRIKNLRKGEQDHLLNATGLQEGMSFLDCTLGLGADAIVASFAVGSSGRVQGVEVNPAIAAMVRYGMQHDPDSNANVSEAMRRVQVQCADYESFLRQQADASFDVVYFDPMFRHPFRESVGLNPMRFLADHRPVSEDAIREALRVARHRVVMKESSHSHEFARLGFRHLEGGRYSKVRYGIQFVDDAT